MSNIYATSEQSVFFPHHDTDVYTSDGKVIVKSHPVEIGTHPNRAHSLMMETVIGNELLPAMKVTLTVQLLRYITFKISFNNVHAIRIDAAGATTKNIYSTAAHFFINQDKYSLNEKTKILRGEFLVAPRHQLNVKIDEKGNLKIENGFQKLFVGILIKISGIGILRSFKARVDYWRAEGNAQNELKTALNFGMRMEDLELSTKSWLFVMNEALKLSVFKSYEQNSSDSNKTVTSLMAMKIQNMTSEFSNLNEPENNEKKTIQNDSSSGSKPFVQSQQPNDIEKQEIIKSVQHSINANTNVEWRKFTYHYDKIPSHYSLNDVRDLEDQIMKHFASRVAADLKTNLSRNNRINSSADHDLIAISSPFIIFENQPYGTRIQLNKIELKNFYNDPLGYVTYRIINDRFSQLNFDSEILQIEEYQKRISSRYEEARNSPFFNQAEFEVYLPSGKANDLFKHTFGRSSYENSGSDPEKVLKKIEIIAHRDQKLNSKIYKQAIKLRAVELKNADKELKKKGKQFRRGISSLDGLETRISNNPQHPMQWQIELGKLKNDIERFQGSQGIEPADYFHPDYSYVQDKAYQEFLKNQEK